MVGSVKGACSINTFGEFIEIPNSVGSLKDIAIVG
jgi:hypothetical protein